jgi:hypothetical protein
MEKKWPAVRLHIFYLTTKELNIRVKNTLRLNKKGRN